MARASSIRGIGFLVKECLRSSVKVCKTNYAPEVEFQWLCYSGRGSLLDTYFCCVYAPGSHCHLAERCTLFFQTLAASCIHYQSKGDVVLLGDFNARLPGASRDRVSNANGSRFLDFLNVSSGDLSRTSNSILPNLVSCKIALRGIPTRVKNGQQSIIDYIVVPLASQQRIQKVHVGTQLQALGANGSGSDHNLLYIDWLITRKSSSSSTHTRPPTRLC
jgi:hypothetical protein